MKTIIETCMCGGRWHGERQVRKEGHGEGAAD